MTTANQEGPTARTPHVCAQHEADLAEVTRQREALADALAAFVAEPLTLTDFGRALLNATAALRQAGRLP